MATSDGIASVLARVSNGKITALIHPDGTEAALGGGGGATSSTQLTDSATLLRTSQFNAPNGVPQLGASGNLEGVNIIPRTGTQASLMALSTGVAGELASPTDTPAIVKFGATAKDNVPIYADGLSGRAVFFDVNTNNQTLNIPADVGYIFIYSSQGNFSQNSVTFNFPAPIYSNGVCTNYRHNQRIIIRSDVDFTSWNHIGWNANTSPTITSDLLQMDAAQKAAGNTATTFVELLLEVYENCGDAGLAATYTLGAPQVYLLRHLKIM